MVVQQQGVTVVGGGGGALGTAVVSRLAAAGRRVVVPTRHPGRLSPMPGVTEIECDLDDLESVAGLRVAVEAMGPWEGVVSASGGFAAGRAHEVDDAAIEAQIAANLLAPWRLARAAAGSMVAAGAGGRIVIVASRAALDVARGQASLSFELRTSMSLAQLHHAHGRTRQARDLLGSVYARFTEGFESTDLQFARRQLEAWA